MPPLESSSHHGETMSPLDQDVTSASSFDVDDICQEVTTTTNNDIPHVRSPRSIIRRLKEITDLGDDYDSSNDERRHHPSWNKLLLADYDAQGVSKSSYSSSRIVLGLKNEKHLAERAPPQSQMQIDSVKHETHCLQSGNEQLRAERDQYWEMMKEMSHLVRCLQNHHDDETSSVEQKKELLMPAKVLDMTSQNNKNRVEFLEDERQQLASLCESHGLKVAEPEEQEDDDQMQEQRKDSKDLELERTKARVQELEGQNKKFIAKCCAQETNIAALKEQVELKDANVQILKGIVRSLMRDGVCDGTSMSIMKTKVRFPWANKNDVEEDECQVEEKSEVLEKESSNTASSLLREWKPNDDDEYDVELQDTLDQTVGDILDAGSTATTPKQEEVAKAPQELLISPTRSHKMTQAVNKLIKPDLPYASIELEMKRPETASDEEDKDVGPPPQNAPPEQECQQLKDDSPTSPPKGEEGKVPEAAPAREKL
jgi:hypothetical protein